MTHSRVKQRRSDKLESRFLVPEEGGFAAKLALYLFKVNNQLRHYQGRVWYTGTKSDSLRNQPMGKNMVSKLPHEIASFLNLPDPSLYTFHSFRRTSASSAADGGSSSAQMTDFFGWKNPAMCQEYVSTSKPAITSMAKKLAGDVPLFNMEDPEVEVDVELEVVQDMENDPMMVESNDVMFSIEEDPKMYAAAGLPLPAAMPTVTPAFTSSATPLDVGPAVKHVIESLSDIKGENVNIKVVVVTGNNTTMYF